VSLFWAFLWNVGTCHPDVKGANQVVNNLKILSTNAGYRDGAVRSSVEVAVMAMERRNCVIQLCLKVNQKSGRSN
jgi:hypothetical protein